MNKDEVNRTIHEDYDSVRVINLWEPTTECGICGQETRLAWAVAWYERPVSDDYPDACMMPVCEKCYQKHYRLDEVPNG